MSTAERYRRFGEAEARGWSPCYEEWARGVAGDADVLARLDELPEPKRQPNLLFAAARFVGVPAGPYPEFRDAVLTRWSTVRNVVLSRRVQTNEPGRCAVLLPLLASLPQPLALLEVGASAGLCLYPERYSYRYGDHPRLGDKEPVIDCEITGPVPVPTELPRVGWRAGVDLNPLNVHNADDVRWLETLVWPEQDNRRRRLAAAIDVARAEPARIVTGDLNENVTALADTAPENATLVIYHSSVLPYLDDEGRAAFAATVRSLDARWIANEVPEALPVHAPPSPAPDRLMTLLALDGEPMAYAGAHGQSLHWLPGHH